MTTTLDEHRGYLCDAVRMDRFAEAIGQAVRPGDVVVDLGCGFAPLGLMALHAGASRVWGIDSTDAIEIARETVQRAGFADRYHCIRDLSFRAELPERADVILCDHVGYFGIDYGIVAMLTDARRRLLKPGGMILPSGLDLTIAGVQSDQCRTRADEWSAAEVPAAFRWLGSYGPNAKRAVSLDPAAICTTPAVALRVDLASDVADNLAVAVELEAHGECRLDGLGGWFSCAITPDVMMTNSPLERTRIARDQAFLPFAQPLDAAKGDRIAVTMNLRHDANIYSWSARNLRSGERRRQSTLGSVILGRDDAVMPGQVATMGPQGMASQIVAGYVDGVRSLQDIEEAILRDHPHLLPSEAALRGFVRAELIRLAR